MRKILSILMISVNAIMFTTAVMANDININKNNDFDIEKIKKEITEQVKKDVIEQIKSNPSFVIEAIIGWREKNINNLNVKDETVETENVPFKGNVDADIIIYEFPDYGCETCNIQSQIIDEIMEEDKNILLFHHDYPTTSVDSVNAAIEIIAEYNVNHDWTKLRSEFLKKGIKNRETILTELNINNTIENKKKAGETLRENFELIKTMSLQNKTDFVIGHKDKIYPITGGITKENLKQKIREIRSE